WWTLRANGSGSNESPTALSRARSPISSWIDRTAKRKSRLLPFPPSTFASTLAVFANAVGELSAASASALRRLGRSPATLPGGKTSGMPTLREGPRAPYRRSALSARSPARRYFVVQASANAGHLRGRPELRAATHQSSSGHAWRNRNRPEEGVSA